MPAQPVADRHHASNGHRVTVADPARLRDARHAAGLSQTALAAEVGCTKATIGHWETGHRTLAYESLAAAVCARLGDARGPRLDLFTGWSR